MPDSSLHLAKPSLAYAKIVATPTESSWSQVYNAGPLFACLSLSLKGPDENVSLHAVGKEIFNNLEAEFFSLEEKTPVAIKKALTQSIKATPEAVAVSLCLAHFRDEILYLFLVGEGKVIIKRKEKIGAVLERKTDDGEILSASGYLQNGDIVVLESKQFAEDILEDTLSQALELGRPNDIAEALSPHIHERDDGGQAAIIITYQGVTKLAPEDEEDEDLASIEAQEPENSQYAEIIPEPSSRKSALLQTGFFSGFFTRVQKAFQAPSLRRVRLPHTKKVYLSVVVIIILLLAVSIFLTKKKQEDARNTALFQSVYTQAQKNYDQAKGIEGLNKSGSREELLKAQKILQENASKLPKGSKEEKQLSELLSKVDQELARTSDTHKTSAKEATIGSSDILKIEKANSDGGVSFAEDSDSVYMLTNKAVTTVDKATGKKKDIIKNDNDWEAVQAISVYQGNIYVLDRKKGVFKYIASGSGFGKTSYFKETPDLALAKAIAIDGSVWILLGDGTVLKYTKGQSDTFKIKGLEKPFANPIKILTSKDIENVYILDPGAGRVVKLSKDGSFKASVGADVIKQAKDFEVLEKDKRILILSNDKIWEIPLQ